MDEKSWFKKSRLLWLPYQKTETDETEVIDEFSETSDQVSWFPAQYSFQYTIANCSDN
jgi:hypothetical protein